MKAENKILKRIIHIASLCIAFVLVYAGASAFFMASDITDIANIRGLYREKENSLDVVSIGSSEVYAAYAPALAYEEYGFTSFDYCAGFMPSNLYEYAVDELLKTQNPKVLVVNANGFLTGTWNHTEDTYLSEWIDNMKWSADKVSMINSLISKENRIGSFFTMYKYHGSWKDPARTAKTFFLRCMVEKNGSRLKGISSFSGVGERSDKRNAVVYDEAVQAALTSFMDHCRERGLENVLFVVMPNQNPMEGSFKEMTEEIEAAGYKVLNLDSKWEEIGLDPETDYWDLEHVNTHGMVKFTSYFGKYLKENYGLTARNDEELEASWEKSVGFSKSILEYAEANFAAHAKGAINELNEIDTYFTPEFQESIKDIIKLQRHKKK